MLLAALGPCADAARCTAKLRVPAELLPQARAALARTALREGDPEKPPPKLDPKLLKGDLAFSLEIEPDGDGYLVRALSLHRPPSLFGRARVKAQPLPRPQQKARAVELALRGGIERAMEDLAAQLAEAAGQGRRALKLSVLVNGLDSASRRYLAETFVPCLKGQFDALGAVTEPREQAGYLEDEIEYVPAADEPRDSLQWQADRLRAASVGQAPRCPAPAKLAPRFTADVLNRGVRVELH